MERTQTIAAQIVCDLMEGILIGLISFSVAITLLLLVIFFLV